MGGRAIRAVLLTLNLLSVFVGASAVVYNVGRSTLPNWTVPDGSINYTEWARTVSLRVGDSLYFKYNPNSHNVVKVNSTSYEACDSKNYLQVWDAGDTTVVILEPGMHYFICGAPTHCNKSQAFAIYALPSLNTPPASDSTVPGSDSSSPSAAALHDPLLRGIFMLTSLVTIVSSLRM